MCEALADHEGNVSIGGRLITKFFFAHDTVVNAEEEYCSPRETEIMYITYRVET